ncbi:MAG TPA: sensor histidine kinase [Gammaproteobacteria bacterium]|nr:sensor histidine kinase [Gammaproteobacteria bacterium]
MQLRQKLFLVLGLMAMVPLLILLFGVVGHIESDLEDRTSKEMNKTLSKLAKEISTLMDNQKSIVRGLAKVPVVRDFASVVSSSDKDSQYENRAIELMAFFLNYQATVPSIQAIRFTDMSGKTLVKIKEGKLIPYKDKLASGRSYVEDIAYKSFFRRAKKTDEDISISDFERGKVLGDVDFCPALVRYSLAIRDELESPFGLLIVNMWGKRVDDAVHSALAGYPGKAYIVELNKDKERDGIYLYHEDQNKRFANQLGTNFRLSTELGDDAWKKINSGSKTGMVTPDNDRLFYYYKFSPYLDRDTKWLLVIEMAREAILEPISGLRNWIVSLILLVFLVGLFIARWAASRLARPVHDLAQIITQYADGDRRSHYGENRRDEIGLAGKAFNYLTKTLEKAQDERIKAEIAARQSERLAAVGQMAAGIGHEINNPLMNIMSLASLIDQNVPDSSKQIKEDLNALQSEGRRCARIVQGVLNFARENKPKYEEFDFSRLMSDTAAVFEHRMKSSEVELIKDLESPLTMQGDSGQLQQVLVNVLVNALHASGPGSTITMKARQSDGKIVAEIIDSGEGVSNENIARAFSPFFTTKPEGSGTGLGLSVSYGIINKHGGSITLENRPEGGARVVIILPKTGVIKEQIEHVTPEVKNATG